jgi:hypothetical protein
MLEIKVDTRKGVKVMQKAMDAAREAALHDVTLHWHREILPDHFKSANMSRYGMGKRTDAYKRRKRRERRSPDPNVYTGRLRDKMLATRPTITTDKHGVKAIYKGLPRHTFIKSTEEYNKKDWQGYKDILKVPAGIHPKHAENLIAWRRRRMEREAANRGKVVRVERPDKVKELTAIDTGDERKLNRKLKEYFSLALKRFTGK